MKMDAFYKTIKCNFTKTLMLSGLIIFIGGCAGPRMLQDRPGVPPATLEPGQTSGEAVAGTELNIPTTTPATMPQQPELSSFPKVSTEVLKYKVKKGDSFWKIARMYGVGMKELAAYNNMDLKKTLVAGKTLDIPPGGKLIPKNQLPPVKKRKKAKARAASPLKGGTYTVKPGDSLWVIAKRYHTTINKITKANDLDKNATLTVGQQLIIPGASTTAKKTAKTGETIQTTSKAVPLSKKDSELIDNLIDSSQKKVKVAQKNKSIDTTIATTNNFLPHTVKDGDTWNTISEMYGVSINSLKKANPKIASEKEPKLGIVINIPEE